MVPQRPQRPVGVILFALALGLLAALLLLSSLVTLARLVSGAGPVAAPPGAVMPSAGMIAAVTLVVSLIYLGIAVWSIATLVGLLRMRSWARISSMVIAGCVVLCSLMGVVGMLGAQSLLHSGSVPLPPNVDPSLLHKVFVVLGAVCLIVAATGVAALVYFASRRTREAFTLFNAPPQTPQHPYGAYPPSEDAPATYPSMPIRPAAPRPAAPDPLTDFTVARPLPPSATSSSEPPPAEDETHTGL